MIGQRRGKSVWLSSGQYIYQDLITTMRKTTKFQPNGSAVTENPKLEETI
jgi:hypothetical protein